MKHQTEQIYSRHERAFLAWCLAQSIDPILASSGNIATYLLTVISRGRYSRGMIGQICAALDRWFVAGGSDLPPTRSERVRSIVRRLYRGQASVPFSTAEIDGMLEACPRTLIGLRDRAAIALAFRAGMRPGVLQQLSVEDYQAMKLAIPEVRDWLAVAEISAGPLFRPVRKGQHVQPYGVDEHWVSRTVKQRAFAAGIDPTHCSGMSLMRAAA